MIIFFGPAGAGKSMQGQMLAAREGWRWLSAGQLMRDTRDPALLQEMQTGKLVSSEKVNAVMGQALARATSIDEVVLDGYPRSIDQAKWLLDNQPMHGHSIKMVIVLEVQKNELMKRLEVRGRADDTFEAIDERLMIYHQEINPILDYFTEQGIKITHIDGMGSVGQVHDRIMKEVTEWLQG